MTYGFNRTGKSTARSAGVALILLAFMLASCVGGSQAKKDASPAQAPQPAAEAPKSPDQAKASGDKAKAPADQAKAPADQAKAPADQAKAPADQAKAPAEPAPSPARPQPVAPTAIMPPQPAERGEKEMLAEADRRSEVLRPYIDQQIAGVKPGPIPEFKEKKPEPPPAKPREEAVAVKAPVPLEKPQPLRAGLDIPSPQPAPEARVAKKPPEKPRVQVREETVTGAPTLNLVKRFTVADGLPSNLISSIYVDEAEAWVGTSGGGIARYIYAESNWIVTGITNGLPSGVVTDVIKYKGKVYVGTKQGIAVWDGFDWTTISEIDQVLLHNISFAVNGKELWVAARNMRGGLLSFDGEKWVDRSTIKQGLILNNVSDFVFDGENLWLGTTSRGVYVKKGKEWLLFSVTEGIASNFIYTMAVKSGKAYLGGCCGVSFYDGEKWVVYDVPEGLPHSTVNAIVWDADNIVWMGSKNGLAAFDGTQFHTFSTEGGLLPDSHITSLFIKGDEVWVGTVGGLSRLSRSR